MPEHANRKQQSRIGTKCALHWFCCLSMAQLCEKWQRWQTGRNETKSGWHVAMLWKLSQSGLISYDVVTVSNDGHRVVFVDLMASSFTFITNQGAQHWTGEVSYTFSFVFSSQRRISLIGSTWAIRDQGHRLELFVEGVFPFSCFDIVKTNESFFLAFSFSNFKT